MIKSSSMLKKYLFTILFGAALLLGANVVQAQDAESYESLMKKGNDKYSAKDFISDSYDSAFCAWRVVVAPNTSAAPNNRENMSFLFIFQFLISF